MEAVKFWSQIAISFCAVLLSPGSWADAAPSEALEALLQNVDHVTAEFSQQLIDGNGYLLESSTGTLYLDKPFFRWDVLEPFAQTIVGKGEFIEVYDPDLEQVTQRNMTGIIDQAPLMLLNQTQSFVTQYFDVKQQLSTEGLDQFVLTPLSAETLFAHLELFFAGPDLHSINIIDHSGQETVIRFSAYQTTQTLPKNLFNLEYPSGTDFVRG